MPAFQPPLPPWPIRLLPWPFEDLLSDPSQVALKWPSLSWTNKATCAGPQLEFGHSSVPP